MVRQAGLIAELTGRSSGKVPRKVKTGSKGFFVTAAVATGAAAAVFVIATVAGGSLFGGSGSPGRVLTAVAPQVLRHEARLLDAGPQSLECKGTSGKLVCSHLTDSGAIAALRAGKTVYQRTVHQGITHHMVVAKLPVFAPDELTCRPSRDGRFVCRLVSESPPKLPVGVTTIATYRRLHVRFEHGQMVERAVKPTIPAK